MTASAWDKFLLLSWKNWIIQLRHPIQTIFEILVPILVCSLLILIRGLVEVTEYPKDFRFKPQSITNITTILPIHITARGASVLAYSPTNPLIDNLVRNVALEHGLLPLGLANADELQKIASTEKPFASIEFEDNLKDQTTLPDAITYALRFPSELRTEDTTMNQLAGFIFNWRTDYKLVDQFSIGPRNKEDQDGGLPPGYINQGFIAIQNSIERQIIYATGAVTPAEMPKLNIRRFPYPAYVNDVIGFILEFAFPTLFLIAFLYNCINIIKYITVEKEMQLKESMKIMGLPSYMHWLAWFAKCILFQIVIISILTGMFKIQFSNRGGLAVFTYTDWTVVWLFLFLYSMALVTYSFMFTTFFNKANIASIVGAIVWFVLILPFNLINNNYNDIGLNVKLVSSLFCNSGMGFGFKVISQYETAGAGVQWSNLFSPVTPDDDLTLGAVMLVLLVASALQMLIALYVEKIKPGEFGVAEKFYFPFTISFWTGKIRTKDGNHDLDNGNNPNFETEPTGRTAGIQVRGLRKVYDKKVAVNNLSLNMYEDQITVLLGHNGAGKSTTMSMLTGLFPPTSGTAFIDGKDIRTDLNSIRSSLGLCPQHNVLFNELTVKEHITFFSKLKGFKKSSDIEEQIRKYVTLLELEPKLNSQSKTLSGGMKRKLSIGIALCGDSKIVMCDEPTSGMDPAARRALWDLLIQEKKGRTILLTTHFMDEADVLGDRIAIMAEGELKTVGSSFYLKKKFGVGYRLVCVKSKGCDPANLTQLLSKFIPGIQIETNIGSELTYVLNENYTKLFKSIFAEIEANTNQLMISSFGVSLTTLEEVFLKVGTDTNVVPEDSADKLDVNGLENGFNNNDILKMDYTKFLYGVPLFFSQVYAMAMKKFLYSIRNYILLIIQFVIPALFVSITMLLEGATNGDKDLPELKIGFDKYISTISTASTSGMQGGSMIEKIFNGYENIFKTSPGDHRLAVTSKDFEDELLDKYRDSVSKTNLEYMVGASFNSTDITAWFNNQGYHTAPLTINLMNNAILKAVTGNAAKSIRLINKPLPFTLDAKNSQLGAGNNLGFNLAFNTGFAMAFVTSMFVMFYIKERVSRAKLLQFVSGVNKLIFWFTSFLIDYVQFILITFVYLGVLAAFQKEGYSSFSELSRNLYILDMFGIAVIPFTYVLSFLFQVPSTGLVRLSIGYIISGVFFFMAYFILNNELLGLQYIAKPLGWIFLIFPHYSLARGMSNLNVKQSKINICDSQCLNIPFCKENGVQGLCDTIDIPCDENTPSAIQFICEIKKSCCDRSFYSFNEDGLAMSYVALAAICLLSFIALFAIEYRWFQNLFYRFKKEQRPANRPESEDGVVDSDVLAEKNKIRSVTSYVQATSNLVVKDFTKFYGKMMAVNQICVGVERGECFGLLGVNGAGKTSTFKMLTGDETISSGEAWVDGISVKTDMNRVHQRIGYCPQFDALLDDLTGRETLRIFALLRGIPRLEINKISMQLANDLNFAKHLDKRIKAYSGGNKRKLSTALSLIGDPSVIYLDEPTSGMDVGARRQLWNMVIKARNSGKSVVLTSHSMEECEVLCTRLAIMVNGEFKCLGSTQHLKNKFSKGFFLTIKIGLENNAESLDQRVVMVKNFVNVNFSGAALKEEYMDILTYHIPTDTIKWSQMFGIMEDAKQHLNINDYSLGQTSLEQVFLFFTKYQRISK